MRVRSYRPEDAEQIMRLFHDTVHAVNARDYTPAQLEAWAPEEVDRGRWLRRLGEHITLVAEDAGSIVGFCEFEPSGHIDCFYAHAAHIGRGVGALMMQSILDLAAEYRVERLFAEVSITALPFFTRQGFRVVREQEVEVRGVRMTNYVMERRLRTEGNG